MSNQELLYSLGFNFEDALVDGIISMKKHDDSTGRLDEVFGALPDCPVSSARPTARIRKTSWRQFSRQVKKLKTSNIEFNFLMNTAQELDISLADQLKAYLKKLRSIGISRLTVGTPSICHFVKSISADFHITISITYGINSEAKLRESEAAGADAVYLDAVYVNRNFELLRKLIRATALETRLYANVGCIACCPVVRQHYKMFAGTQTNSTVLKNDAYFAGCTLLKMLNPVEWIQMPWIRPEDIHSYVSEGVSHFKLADRLATTTTLLRIAKSYLRGVSPNNLFTLMERDGLKFQMFSNSETAGESTPITVSAQHIPSTFIDHFRSGDCNSSNVTCGLCSEIAAKAVSVHQSVSPGDIPELLKPLVPDELLRRLEKH